MVFTISEDIYAHAGPFYDATVDGQRFVMVQNDLLKGRPLELVVVPNWITEL